MTDLHEVDCGHGSVPLAFHSVALAANPLACPKDAQHRALPAQILPCLALVHIPVAVREHISAQCKRRKHVPEAHLEHAAHCLAKNCASETGAARNR